MKKFIALLLSVLCCLCAVSCTPADNHEHDWSIGKSTTEHWKICTLCGLTQDIAAHFDSDDDDVCDVCGHVMEEVEEHIHSYSWRHNDEEHWKECSCGDVTNRESHRFGSDNLCECGAVKDTPPTDKQDTKNYYLVGSFMNWQTIHREDLKFSRLAALDENGMTVFVKDIDLYDGYSFKIVNDGNESDFWENQLHYLHLTGGNARDSFTTEGNNSKISIKSGNAGSYRITLHTDYLSPANSYVEISLLSEISDPDHQHTFSADWAFDSNYHWHAATCSHSDAVKDKAQHTIVNGICNVCGYSVSGGGDPNAPDGKYEFGDSVSILNDAFYKDYTAEEKALYYDLWKETTKISVKIDISPYELAKINEAEQSGDGVKKDTYRKCNLIITVNGTDYKYEEVGIRMRGNTSRRQFCNSDGLIYAYVHFRFSLTETFDGEEYQSGSWGQELYHDWSNDAEGRKARKDRSFATMEKFFYKWNKNYDQTYVKEVYANRMFQAYGILAPHITLTEINVKQNGNMERLGVGGLYELIDKHFIKRNFDKTNKGGDLYKCTYTSKGPANLSKAEGYGIETPYEGFSYDLKTNDDPEDFNNHKYLLALIEALKAPKSEAFSEKLETLVDMDYFARFEAVNYFVGNPDCIRNNSNNYYIYFTPSGKAYFIPYDYDRCFGINKDWNPSGNGMTGVTPYDTNSCNGAVTNPLYTKTILRGGMEKYQKSYQSKLQSVLDGRWFTYENFSKIYSGYKATYENLVTPSSLIQKNCSKNVDLGRLAFSDSGTNDFGSSQYNISMKEYMTKKRQTANRSINNI